MLSASSDKRRSDCKACVRKRQQANYASKPDFVKSGQHVKTECPQCGKPKTRISILCQTCSRPPFDPDNPKWRSNRRGYIVCSGPDGKEISQHRWVMQQMLGRKLMPHENVHHINGIREDNRPDNLELWSTSQPSGQRIEDKLAWAQWFIEQYGSVAERQCSSLLNCNT